MTSPEANRSRRIMPSTRVRLSRPNLTYWLVLNSCFVAEEVSALLLQYQLHIHEENKLAPQYSDSIQETGDFDADGKSDILWRHDSGQVYIWEMNGLQVKAEGVVAHASVPNDWHISA
jgi:hypothetical protein